MAPSRRRFVLVTVVAAGAALAAFVAGMLLGLSLLASTATALGLSTLAVRSPTDLVGARLGLGAALALPPMAAWAALFVHRVRRGVDAGALPALLYLGVPLAAVASGMALRFVWLRAALRDAPRGGGDLLSLFVAVPDVSLHAWGIELGLLATVALCLGVWLRGARP